MEEQRLINSGDDLESNLMADTNNAGANRDLLLRLFTVWTWVSSFCGRRGPGGNAVRSQSPNHTEGQPLTQDVAINDAAFFTNPDQVDPNLQNPGFLRLICCFCCGRRAQANNLPAPGDAGVRQNLPQSSVRRVLGQICCFCRRRGAQANDAPAAPGNNANTGEWSKFVKDANDFIQWMITNIFLFLPVKTFVVYWTTADMSSIPDELIKLFQSLPDMFIPTVLLYACFYLGARAFSGTNFRFGFELVSLFIGGVAMVEVLAFAAADLWKWTLAAFVVYVIILAICLVWDCVLNYRRN